MLKFYLFFLFAAAFVQGEEADANKRIVGGSIAPDGAFPWQVSMRTKKNHHFCGGSIIDTKWILTAAHCIISETDEMVIVAGTNELLSGGVEYEVEEVIKHENYVPQTLANDIALMKLKKDIEYTEKIKAIEIDETVITGVVKCIVTGWGYFNNYRQTPNELQMLTVTVRPQEECKEELGPIKPAEYTDGNMCAYDRYGVGICQGDSGGPLIKDNKQVGIVSYNIPCGRGYPDAYTRLSYFADWIKTNKKE